ncbi:unnamed protein product, partial [Rotaria sp. Silwood1]
MAQTQEFLSLTDSERKIKTDDQDKNGEEQEANQQQHKIVSLLQELLAKQNLLTQDMATQKITVNNLSQAVEALQGTKISYSNIPLTNPSLPPTTTSVSELTPSMMKSVELSLKEQASKKLQSKRIDQLLNSIPFSGSNSQEVSDWIEYFDDKCDQLQLEDVQRLSVAIDLLTGNAKLWYDTHKHTIDDWITLKNKLTTYFKLVTGSDQFQLEQKLYNRRRQPNELAIDYCHSILKLCSKVNKLMDEETRLKHLTKGLNPAAQLHMDLTKPGTTEEFFEALIKYDKWQEEEKSQQKIMTSSDQRRNISTRTMQHSVIQREKYSTNPRQQQHNYSSQQYQSHYPTPDPTQMQYNRDKNYSGWEVRDGRISFSKSQPSLITISTLVNGKPIHAMLDTGATTSLISQSELNHIPHITIQPIQTMATLGDGQTKIMVNSVVKLNVTINHITTIITALVVESLAANLILGMDWCNSNYVNVNIGKKQVEINHPQHGTTTTPFLEVGSVERKHGTKNKVPYLPSSMIHAVLKAFHDHPMSGHFGVKRTLYKIRTRFWWPNMRKSIEHYISSCQQCMKFNILRSKTPGHLKSFDPPTDVFQILHMDFWGPVRPSAQGNRYVLVLTDNLSKYVIAKAMPNNTAKVAAEFIMNEFIMIHGAPERLITDNGVHFNNTLLKTITTTMHIPHVFSASYHPQTNGQIERFNATFCTQLAKYYDENKDDWDDYLQSVVYAYNTGIHATTGFVP